jgi:hypothetical protein
MSCVKSQLWKIDELAKLVHPRAPHPKVFVMIDAYLDESGIHDGAAVCVIAGYFGGQGQWRKFEKLWRGILKEAKFPLEKFHAKDLVKNMAKHGGLLFQLADAIAKYKIYPVSSSVVVSDFNSYSLGQRKFLTGARPKNGKLVTSGCPSKPYFMPFQDCVRNIAEHTPVGGRAHFFFGLDRPFAGYAQELFKDIKNNPLAPLRERLGDPGFPQASETPQLQAADLVVHLTYRDLPDRLANFKCPIPKLLKTCLRNARILDDFVCYNKHSIDQTLREVTGEWNVPNSV